MVLTAGTTYYIVVDEKSVTRRSVSGDPSLCVMNCDPLAGDDRGYRKSTGLILKSGGRGKPETLVSKDFIDPVFGAFFMQASWNDDTVIRGITVMNSPKCAVEIWDASPSFINCRFNDNTGELNGGAIFSSRARISGSG